MAKQQGKGPTLRSWLVAGTIGSALALLLDGNRGKQRRKKVRHAGTSLYGTVNKQVKQRKNSAANSSFGGAAEAFKPHTPDNPAPDDNTLRDRIESEVFGNPNAPKGEYNLSVFNGIATIRGQLSAEAEITQLVELIGAVEHVRGVESLLHMPGTDAPNKEGSIHASDVS